MQPVYLRHHIALLSLLRVREGERESNSGSEVWMFGLIFRDLIFVSLSDAYKMYGDAKMYEDVRGLREKWRMRKRAQERERDGQTEEKKDTMPFNKPPLR